MSRKNGMLLQGFLIYFLFNHRKIAIFMVDFIHIDEDIEILAHLVFLYQKYLKIVPDMLIHKD